jgi:hypothetical protein
MPADIDPLKRATDMADEMRMEADAPIEVPLADQLRDMTADRDSLRQALWDVHAALGFDTDGDKTPDALVTPIGPMVVAAAEEFRRDYEEAIAAPSAVAAEDARAISYHRDDEGHEAIEAYAKIVASVDKEEALPRLANLVAHGARATLGPGGVVLTRSDWKTLKIIPLATPHPAPALADITADRDSWQKQASQFLDDALEFARQRDEAVKECKALRAEHEKALGLLWRYVQSDLSFGGEAGEVLCASNLHREAAAITQSMEGKT